MTKVSEDFILKNFDEAIDKGYIKAYYQPIVRSITRNISDSEALARWEDPELGMISPMDFIPVLEKHKLIQKLDLCMLRCICDTYRKIKAEGCIVPQFSINLSRIDFKYKDLYDEFMAILKEYDVPVEAIRVEITESVMLDDQGRFREILDKFKDSGFHIWMDDFGSGYSSLNVLKDYNFDLLKIDAAFLKNFGNRSKQMLTAVINMAKVLGIHTLTEGIETEEQYSFMLDAGCELIQGYYFFKPLSAEEFIMHVKKENKTIEPDDETAYWDAVGNFNFLSSNPLEMFISGKGVNGEDSVALLQGKTPLALLEYKDGKTKCVYYNDEYYNRIRQLGYSCVEEVEKSFNDRKEVQHNMMEAVLDKSIENNSVERIDYVENGVYFTIKTKCISKHNDKYMMAITLYTFESDKEKRKTDDILRFNQSVFLTYDIVVLMYLPTNRSDVLFSQATFNYEYADMKLDEAITQIAEREISEKDKVRYLKFMDLSTLDKRIKMNGRIFIQEAFRVRNVYGGYEWKQIRVTKTSDSFTIGYLYTVQDMSDEECELADYLCEKHPKFMTD
ncbi:MAG: EAL domain-containing protein [Lachnospiraceae bacterium]|nr:EAL domain-containing protein [Lachnospiraceae bacterium]